MKQEEKIIAIHEAAHAAICLKEKVSFGKVTIFSNEDYFGKVALSKDFITNLISNPKAPRSRSVRNPAIRCKCICPIFTPSR